MNLKSQIDQDFIASYKAKEEMKVSLLRMIKSAIKNAEINEKHELDDSEIIKILKREIKQRKDSITEFKRGNRADLVEKEEAEIKLVEAYLPEQLSDSELEKIVKDTIQRLGATEMKDMGKVIGAVIKETGDLADGGKISALVKSALQK